MRINIERKGKRNRLVYRDGVLCGYMFQEPGAAGWVGFCELADGRSILVSDLKLSDTARRLAEEHAKLTASPPPPEPAPRPEGQPGQPVQLSLF